MFLFLKAFKAVDFFSQVKVLVLNEPTFKPGAKISITYEDEEFSLALIPILRIILRWVWTGEQILLRNLSQHVINYVQHGKVMKLLAGSVDLILSTGSVHHYQIYKIVS